MTKLTDTQLVVLTAAVQRDGNLVQPLPAHLKGGAATKVVDGLIAKGLVEEVDAQRGEPFWRETGDGHGTTLVATDAALSLLGIKETGATRAADVTPARKTREGSKQGALIGMLKRPEGASIAEIVDAFGWQPHTVRGAIAGALKKKLGLTVTSEKVDDRGRVYRIPG
ncbi:MAG: DUF3489 domain-containing protein [Magnetospirillum sp. WYHS-4]